MQSEFIRYINGVITSAIYDFNKEHNTNYDWREDDNDSDIILIYDSECDEEDCDNCDEHCEEPFAQISVSEL